MTEKTGIIPAEQPPIAGWYRLPGVPDTLYTFVRVPARPGWPEVWALEVEALGGRVELRAQNLGRAIDHHVRVFAHLEDAMVFGLLLGYAPVVGMTVGDFIESGEPPEWAVTRNHGKAIQYWTEKE